MCIFNSNDIQRVLKLLYVYCVFRGPDKASVSGLTLGLEKKLKVGWEKN